MAHESPEVRVDSHDKVQKNCRNTSRLNELTHITQFNYDDHWKEIEIHLERPPDVHLGFSIVGGTNVSRFTGCRAIVITHITKDSFADRDQQLKLHDIILCVNNISFINIEHQAAVDILRSVRNNVNLLIRRLLPPILEKIYLYKPPNAHLGFSIGGGIGHEHIKGDCGIFIINMIPGDIADENGQLEVGDRLMHIQSSENSYDLTFVERQHAAELIRDACNGNQAITLSVAHPTDSDGAMNPQRKPALRQRMENYMKRIEVIKGALKNGLAKKKPIADISNGCRNTKENNDAIATDPQGIFDDVIGLKEAKETLSNAIILPVKSPYLFHGNRKSWTSILLYGPTGTGKSYLAKAIDVGCECTFVSVSPSDLVSKWLGESEKKVKDLFKLARERQPCILFFDHIDGLCGKYYNAESETSRRIKNEFLVQMQSVGQDNSNVLVLAATNIPWAVDTVILQSFDRRIYMPLPDVNERVAMFKTHLGFSNYHSMRDHEWMQLAQKAENYSGADIDVVCREALVQLIRRLRSATHFKRVQNPNAYGPRQLWLVCSPLDPDAQELTLSEIKSKELCEPPVTMKDMLTALATHKPTVDKSKILAYTMFTREFGR
ncbi:unnamed protein product [Rotaria magnacalcarata]|uniref:PDZ domain-containing protein n=4 Tax=Rotaria magnacalcarata TaxID=392030 RepID=A0A814SDH4_9BILA|nr:unnamed protein product [Rotaria magnacalcarata]